jgi:16S rRNA (guanine(966)-N(2))-methyltransferase RsmD
MSFSKAGWIWIFSFAESRILGRISKAKKGVALSMRSSGRGKRGRRSYTVTVNGGRYKGKKIEIPAVDTTRSSKAILRGSLFDTIQFDIVGKSFIEVFAGSGSIAIEAVSRGAEHAWCMERDRFVYDILVSNVENISPGSFTTVFGDSFELFESVYERARRAGRGIYFYFDPPFDIRDGMEEIYDKCLSLMETIEPESCEMVVVEHMSSKEMPEEVGSLRKSRSRRFGKSSLSYYIPHERGGDG